MTRAKPPLFSMDTFIGLVADRLLLVAQPPSGEPSPAASGVPAATWAEWAGVGAEPHPILRRPAEGKPRPDMFLDRFDVEPYDPATVTQASLQRLSQRGITECVGGIPRRWRPVPGATIRARPRRV